MEDDGLPAELTLDLRHLACPLPVLKTRKALRPLAPGARLLVEATDDMALIDIPHCCAQDGHRLIDKETIGGIHRFLIERGQRP